jgi:hypothetical protein
MRRPIACPAGTDLAKCELIDLKRIARHTHLLEQNWNNEHPRICASARLVLRQEHRHNILAVIPGTSMTVIHVDSDEADEESIVLCTFDDVPGYTKILSLKMFDQYAYNDEGGRYLMAFAFRPIVPSGR